MDRDCVCIIGLGNLFAMPYIKKYIDIICNKVGRPIDIELIYWNRCDMKEEIDDIEQFVFNYSLDDNSNKIQKLLAYIKYFHFVKKILKFKKNIYSKIIVTPTSCGIFLLSTLLKSYKYKYIVDIRDYTFEGNKLFYFLEKILIKYSGLSIISSSAYQTFLPKHKYLLTHNSGTISETIAKDVIMNRKYNSQPIVISCIGVIRFYEQNIKVIQKFGNDDRFVIRFIGHNAKNLENYCVENKINNIELTDRFEPCKTIEFYKNTDMINNLYGNNNPYLDYALSNKLYYSATLQIPIIVSPKTFMEEIVKKYSLGIAIDIDSPHCANQVFDFYTNLNIDEFEQNCKRFIEIVQSDNNVFENEIKKFLNK